MLIWKTWKNTERYIESKSILNHMKKNYSQHTDVFLSVFSVFVSILCTGMGYCMYIDLDLAFSLITTVFPWHYFSESWDFTAVLVFICPPLTETKNRSCLGIRAAHGGVVVKRWRGYGGELKDPELPASLAWGWQEWRGREQLLPGHELAPVLALTRTSPCHITSLPFSRPHGLLEMLVSAGS